MALESIPTKAGGRMEFLNLDLGTGEEPESSPLVLVHGLACTWRVWNKQLRDLCRSRRVVAVNLRGSGGSIPPAGARAWSTGDMAADIRDVVEHLELGRPDVVGLSLGGAVALQYAIDHPEAIGRLVVVAGFAAIPDGPHKAAELDRILDHSSRETAERRMDVAFTPKVDPALKAWTVDMIAPIEPVFYAAQARAAFEHDARVGARSVTAPTTVIAGVQDRTVPLSVVAEIAELVPGARLLRMEGEGHFANLERPELFNPLLKEALGMSA